MLVVEVNNGFCREPFESEFVPRPTFKSIFVDITNVEPKPQIHWRYDYKEKKFYPPPVDWGAPTCAAFIEQRWNDIRNHRQILLMETDWVALKDCPLSFWEKRKWLKFRQELRDLPQKYADEHPMYVSFPPRPSHVAKPPFLWTLKRFFQLLLEKNK